MNSEQNPPELIVSGLLVVPGHPPERGEVHVANGTIVAVIAGSTADSHGVARIDAGRALVFPGAIDCHVHSGSHQGEGITALTRSAAAGGVTTVVDMPYDAVGPVDSTEAMQEKIARLSDEAVVDVALLATVRPDAGAGDVAPLVEAGAAGFKLSTFCTDAYRFPRVSGAQFLDVLAAVRDSSSVVLVHAEAEDVIKPRIDEARASGDTSPRAHCRSRPPVSETAAVLTALEYARATDARLHLCHLSLPRSVDLVRRAVEEGVHATSETCPHYLVFCDEDMDRLGGRLKINPPVRSAEDRDAMWGRVLNGAIDVVSSDHAPWPLSYKTKENIFDNHSGAPGVETLFAIVAGGIFARGGSAGDVARLLSDGPARLFGLNNSKGSLEVGKDADMVFFDPDAAFVVDEAKLHSNAGWSPYHGLNLSGRVTMAISRGEVVYDGSEVVGAPGRGRLLQPGRPHAANAAAKGDSDG